MTDCSVKCCIGSCIHRWVRWRMQIQLWVVSGQSFLTRVSPKARTAWRLFSAVLPGVLWPCITNLKLIVNWSTQQLNDLTALDELSELNWLVLHWEIMKFCGLFSVYAGPESSWPVDLVRVIIYSRRMSFCKLLSVTHKRLSKRSPPVRYLVTLIFFKALECLRHV